MILEMMIVFWVASLVVLYGVTGVAIWLGYHRGS